MKKFHRKKITLQKNFKSKDKTSIKISIKRISQEKIFFSCSNFI